MYRDTEERFLGLGLINYKGIGPKRYSKIIEKTGIDHDLTSVINSLYGSSKIKIPTKKLIEEGKRLHSILEAKGIRYFLLGESNYPALLAEIYDPPGALYYLGDQEILGGKNLVSIVGTRKVSTTGIRLAKHSSVAIAKQGLVTVSGMAFGVDAAVHSSTVEVDGRTIAVLPGGVDNPTPSSNRYLYEKILANGGAVVSEMFPGKGIVPGMFPLRNRIIAGIARATVVIEASVKSGALITARLAHGYGREVFAFPAPVGYKGLAGTNILIKRNKAQLVEGGNDILEMLGFGVGGYAVENHPNKLLISLNSQKVFNLIEQKPYTINEICDKLRMPILEVMAEVSNIQLKGLIYEDDQLCYRLSKI